MRASRTPTISAIGRAFSPSESPREIYWWAPTSWSTSWGPWPGCSPSLLLNVQLHRPGLAKSIALVVLGVLLTIFIAAHNSTMPEWLLLGLWAGIGLLAGLGRPGCTRPDLNGAPEEARHVVLMVRRA